MLMIIVNGLPLNFLTVKVNIFCKSCIIEQIQPIFHVLLTSTHSELCLNRSISSRYSLSPKATTPIHPTEFRMFARCIMSILNIFNTWLALVNSLKPIILIYVNPVGPKTILQLRSSHNHYCNQSPRHITVTIPAEV